MPDEDEMDPRRTEILAGLRCPRCHATLSVVLPPELPGYRCPQGHEFLAGNLLAEGGADRPELEKALRRALDAWGERAVLLREMAASERRAGRSALADDFERTAFLLEGRCGVIRETLAAA
ncbi:MAG TPA: hypothetical protein VNO22_12825 [Planctomycetota bacterium]|jgi:hypothetical protein|nr:hypothetical protein [Planctomycetota bacterium]